MDTHTHIKYLFLIKYLYTTIQKFDVDKNIQQGCIKLIKDNERF